jgi:hypothetical protein
MNEDLTESPKPKNNPAQSTQIADEFRRLNCTRKKVIIRPIVVAIDSVPSTLTMFISLGNIENKKAAINPIRGLTNLEPIRNKSNNDSVDASAFNILPVRTSG